MCSPVGSHGEGRLHGHHAAARDHSADGPRATLGIGVSSRDTMVLYGTNASLQQPPSREHE